MESSGLESISSMLIVCSYTKLNNSLSIRIEILNSKPGVKRSYLAFVLSLFLVLCACLQNYDYVVVAYMPTPSKSAMPTETVPITNIVVGNDPEHFTYVNPVYGIKMQYPTNWYKHTGRFIYELANGTTHELVSFSPIFANQTAALNSLRLHFHLTPSSESLLKKTYPSGIPDFNASLSLSVYYPKNKGKTVSQYASDEYGFGKLLGLTNTTLGGLSAYNSTYASLTTTFSSPYPEISMHIGAIEGDNLFILIYKAIPNEYDKYLPIVQQIIDTSQISNSTKSIDTTSHASR
jgi:hypothetical protein